MPINAGCIDNLNGIIQVHKHTQNILFHHFLLQRTLLKYAVSITIFPISHGLSSIQIQKNHYCYCFQFFFHWQLTGSTPY